MIVKILVKKRSSPRGLQPMELITWFVHCPAEPLGGVKNLQVTDPTTSSLRVRWEPAEGDVRQYQVIYVPAAGGAESMVGS